MKELTSILIALMLVSVQTFANNNSEDFFVGGVQVTAFPNPANDKLELTVNTSAPNIMVKIKVYDVLGKLVMSRIGTDADGTGKSNNVIDVNEFFPGIYTIVVTDGNGVASPPVRVMVSH